MSLNVVCIVGNVVRDADLAKTNGNVSVCNFTLAVNDRRRNSDTNQWEEYPNFIDCCIFGPRAEALSGMLLKGRTVSVQGKLRQNQWIDNTTGKKRSRITVTVEDVSFINATRNKIDVPDTAVSDLGFEM